MEQTAAKKLSIQGRWVSVCLIIFAAIAAVCALALTFTVSDYYIFNRIGEYGVIFCVSQWVKKAGLLLIALAVFFNCKSCADAVKYFLPLFVILSCFLFGGFFDAEPQVAEGDINGEIFKGVNSFFPRSLNVALFFIQNAALLLCCGLLFIRDGFKIPLKSLITFPAAVAMALPLNIFENFFDITKISLDSPLRFYNFTIWHFIAILILVGCTVGLYYFLKNKDRKLQDKYLAAIALCLLLQYHSKDSMLLGDGYNVYKTVFACLPLFICNIGVYVACISVILKRKALYSISFFIHAVGALTVFVYFGKNSMSNYGIFCSYSILYFCLTHCLLFALCVLPSALGHYKFEIKKCWIPLLYYFAVIVVASLASTLVSYASANWTTESGEHLVYDPWYVTGITEDGQPFMRPNFAFTQVNPLPFEVPNLIPLGGVLQYINIFYVLLVYVAYVCLFFAFYGVYQAFLAARRAVIKRLARSKAVKAPVVAAVAAEAAVAEATQGGDKEADDPAAEEQASPQDEPEAAKNYEYEYSEGEA